MTLGNLWFHESIEGLTTGLQIEQTLAVHQSPYQKICIYETSHFGRMMTLDGCIMMTERDEFLYHEMLVHPVVCSHEAPSRALVIGGGDGGTVRELLRYPFFESIEMVELDEAVVRLSQEHLPGLSCGLEDPKVTLYFEDGVAFMKERTATYDLIFVDSTDPVGPAAGLITQDFYQTCLRALRPEGILALQSESPFLHQQALQTIHRNVSAHFSQCHLYHAPMLSYPSGWWSFVFASQSRHPKADFQPERAEEISAQLQYYNPEIHHAALALPNFVKALLREGGS